MLLVLTEFSRLLCFGHWLCNTI